MKNKITLIFLTAVPIIGVIFSFGYTLSGYKISHDKYSIHTPDTSDDFKEQCCAKMQDGKLIMLREGNLMTSEVTLGNGAVIRPDCTVVQRDGSKITLKAGECIKEDGKIIEETLKETFPNEMSPKAVPY